MKISKKKMSEAYQTLVDALHQKQKKDKNNQAYTYIRSLQDMGVYLGFIK